MAHSGDTGTAGAGRRAYPSTPPGWRVRALRAVGPFATHVTWERPEGTVVEWSSRAHRKRTSRLSRPGRAGVWLTPHRVSWWIGVLFAIGATCFFVGPFPGFVELVGSGDASRSASRR